MCVCAHSFVTILVLYSATLRFVCILAEPIFYHDPSLIYSIWFINHYIYQHRHGQIWCTIRQAN